MQLAILTVNIKCPVDVNLEIQWSLVNRFTLGPAHFDPINGMNRLSGNFLIYSDAIRHDQEQPYKRSVIQIIGLKKLCILRKVRVNGYL